jgi:predicted ribosomally synthesized peptide with SipW-like signal peptide
MADLANVKNKRYRSRNSARSRRPGYRVSKLAKIQRYRRRNRYIALLEITFILLFCICVVMQVSGTWAYFSDTEVASHICKSARSLPDDRADRGWTVISRLR